ncbi:hypothetical protein PIB30_070648, partial [Stylosanthes scabra]|nr:hypothetical protein [Stylosanthes scabra]
MPPSSINLISHIPPTAPISSSAPPIIVTNLNITTTTSQALDDNISPNASPVPISRIEITLLLPLPPPTGTSSNTHSMLIRSKTGTHNPKVFQ